MANGSGVRHVTRRAFVQGAGLAGLGLLAGCGRWPGQAPGQQPTKSWRVGMMLPNAAGVYGPHSPVGAFQQALVDHGYVQGRNIIYEYRFAEGQSDRWNQLAAELIAASVDLIFTPNIPGATAAKQATETIPIVMPVGDQVGAGLAESLAHPGGNVTGLTNISTELSGKRLELLKEIVPELSRVALLWMEDNVVEARDLQETQAAARLLGVALQPVALRAPVDIDGAFKAILGEGAEAVLARGTGIQSQQARFAAAALRSRVPVMSDRRTFAEAGCLMTYGPNLDDLYRRAATYVDKILRGANPADLPIERPREFEFVINLKTAQALGLTIPEHVLLQATEVLQ